MKKKSGFTLIELIIVLAILALLVAIAVPKYNASRKRAAITAHHANIATLESAAQLCWFEESKPFLWNKTNDGWRNYIKEWPKVPNHLSVSDKEYVVNVDKTGTINITPSKEVENSLEGE